MSSELKSKLKRARRKMHQEELNFERARGRRDYWRRLVNALEDKIGAKESGQLEFAIEKNSRTDRKRMGALQIKRSSRSLLGFKDRMASNKTEKPNKRRKTWN